MLSLMTILSLQTVDCPQGKNLLEFAGMLGILNMYVLNMHDQLEFAYLLLCNIEKN